jgi:hypothetical protein
MKSFFKKLDQLVNIIDNEMQQPIVQVLTGEVFTHDPSSHAHSNNATDESTRKAARHVMTAAAPTREPRPIDANPVCPPRLRPAGAHKK